MSPQFHPPILHPMADVVTLYAKELRNDNSNKEESLDLIRKIRGGDEAARERLIKNYLLFVMKIAREYQNSGIPLADIISEGNIGLMTAIDKYKLEKGTPFSTCAQYWIRAFIFRNCIHKRRTVRIPENISNLIMSGRWEGQSFREVSIDTKNAEGESMAKDIPEPNSQDIFVSEEKLLLKRKVEKLLSYSSDRDADIVRKNYGIGYEDAVDIEDLAIEYNLTTTRINQIIRNTLQKARNNQIVQIRKTNEVIIVSAKYGAEENYFDLTEKISLMVSEKREIKVGNKLGGDPVHGTKKSLIIEYRIGDKSLTRSFPEGSFAKF